MRSEAATWGLSWDLTAAQGVAASQQWVLASMQKHGPVLVQMLWRILGNEQDVCDAYQDTFVRLAQSDGGARARDTRAFVLRSAANTAISLLRRRRCQRVAVQRLAARPLPAAPEAGSDIDQQALRERLRACIAHLPGKLREVILLKDLAELPYEQVARALGLSAATARVYRCRAVQLLAAWLGRREEDVL
jgi:RNA polymerase sigma-70 factor (ECF subfamily)